MTNKLLQQKYIEILSSPTRVRGQLVEKLDFKILFQIPHTKLLKESKYDEYYYYYSTKHTESKYN